MCEAPTFSPKYPFRPPNKFNFANEVAAAAAVAAAATAAAAAARAAASSNVTV